MGDALSIVRHFEHELVPVLFSFVQLIMESFGILFSMLQRLLDVYEG